MYGAGFLAMAGAVGLSAILRKPFRGKKAGLPAIIIVLWFVCSFSSGDKNLEKTDRMLKVAGIQLEFPTDDEVVLALDKLLIAAPKTELFVLSEYTFDGPVPEKVLSRCRTHHRYLIVGGKDSAPNQNFYDTAFVIGPGGDVVFHQVKAVPIQFFKDGLPAPEQRVWDSPWGKIGLCVCYDLSYTAVVDSLIRLGAQAIIVPTMDMVTWGRREHELHARVAPVRAAEYGVPIFRIASSGISQLVTKSGQTKVQASFPGEGETLVGTLALASRGSLPLDRWLAPLAVVITAFAILVLAIRAWT